MLTVSLDDEVMGYFNYIPYASHIFYMSMDYIHNQKKVNIKQIRKTKKDPKNDK